MAVPFETAADLVRRLGNIPLERKLREYFLAGVRLVWMIDPRKRTAKVYTAPDAPSATLDENQVLEGGKVLPGFTLPLAELFARLPSVPRKTRSSRKKKY
jgi:hypothetical protein